MVHTEESRFHTVTSSLLSLNLKTIHTHRKNCIEESLPLHHNHLVPSLIGT